MQDEKKRKLLKVRLEMAKFLQETIRESGIKSPDKIKESEDFKEFFRKVCTSSKAASTPNELTRAYHRFAALARLLRPTR